MVYKVKEIRYLYSLILVNFWSWNCILCELEWLIVLWLIELSINYFIYMKIIDFRSEIWLLYVGVDMDWR